MRYKDILTGLTRSNRAVFNPFGFTITARTFATAPQNPPHLMITEEFLADDGRTKCKAIANDPTKTRENNVAFKSALISTRFTDITVPAGRYYFSEPLTNIVNGTPTLFPNKTIKGSELAKCLSFPNVGYNLDLDCPSTILDFTQLEAKRDTLITISGHHETPFPGTGPVSRGVNKVKFESNRGIKRGDIFALTNPNDASYGARLGARNGELVMVTGLVEGRDTTVYVNPIMGDYPDLTLRLPPQTVHTGNDPNRNPSPNPAHIPQNLYTWAKLNLLKDILIENITIIDTRKKERRSGNIKGAPTALNLTQCMDSKLNNVYIIDASHHIALQLNNCVNLQINSGNYVVGIPDRSRITKPTTAQNSTLTEYTNYSQSDNTISGYTDYYQVDGYGIMMGDSQNITIDGASASAWTHAITSGGGSEKIRGDNGSKGIFWIVNRNLVVKNCTLTNTPAPIYYFENGVEQPQYAAQNKVSPANFHVNTENSIYMNNTLHGSGFNICGHNIILDGNTIYINNRHEAFGRYLRHYGDSAFYFNETKSGEFKVINNKVFISGFYQNPKDEAHEQTDKDEFRFGEFLTFNLGGIFGRSENTPYTYWLSEVIYPNSRSPDIGLLDIRNNSVQINCSGEDHNTDYSTGLITIGGVTIDRYLDEYINKGNAGCQYANQEAQAAKDAIRQLHVDVKISGNTFSIFNNPRNSKVRILINPQRTEKPSTNGNYSRIRNVTIEGNKFCGNFRFSFNKSAVFENTNSDLVKIRDNQFWSDLLDVESHIKENIHKTTGKDIENNRTSYYSGSCSEVSQCSAKN